MARRRSASSRRRQRASIFRRWRASSASANTSRTQREKSPCSACWASTSSGAVETTRRNDVQAVRRRAHPPVRVPKAELAAGRDARVHVFRQMPHVDGLPRRRHEGQRAGWVRPVALDQEKLAAGQARERLRDTRPFARHRRQRRAEKRQLVARGGARQDEEVHRPDDALPQPARAVRHEAEPAIRDVQRVGGDPSVVQGIVRLVDEDPVGTADTPPDLPGLPEGPLDDGHLHRVRQGGQIEDGGRGGVLPVRVQGTVHVGGLVDLHPRHARQMRQHPVIPLGIDDADRVARGHQALHERAGQPRFARMRIAVDQDIDAAGRDRNRPGRCRHPSDGDAMPGRVRHGQAIRQDLFGDGRRDAGAVTSGEDPVHALQDGGEAIPRAAAEFARVEERQVVLRVAQGQHVVRRQARARGAPAAPRSPWRRRRAAA